MHAALNILLFASCMICCIISILAVGAYIHIPFCRRRCYYCDFSVRIVGDRESSIKREAEVYTDLLLKDIARTVERYENIPPLETIYFGGGTPSLLPNDCIERIMSTLHNKIGIVKEAEVSFEMDPATFDTQTTKSLRALGINRVSLGLQSFNDTTLELIGRAHRMEDIYRAIESVVDGGVENFSVDLISALPHMTIDSFKSSLYAAASCGAKHISVYDLQVEEKTAFNRWYTPGVYPLPTEDLAADMYKTAVKVLDEYGFDHYEVSNYARKGYKSRHNLKYWACEPVWGFGMAAASYINGERTVRPSNMQRYSEFVHDLESGSMLDICTKAKFRPHMTENPDIFEFLMLTLRTKCGLDLLEFEKLYGSKLKNDVLDASKEYLQHGLMSINCSYLRLSDPNGFLISNEIISKLFTKVPVITS